MHAFYYFKKFRFSIPKIWPKYGFLSFAPIFIQFYYLFHVLPTCKMMKNKKKKLAQDNLHLNVCGKASLNIMVRIKHREIIHCIDIKSG